MYRLEMVWDQTQQCTTSIDYYRDPTGRYDIITREKKKPLWSGTRLGCMADMNRYAAKPRPMISQYLNV